MADDVAFEVDASLLEVADADLGPVPDRQRGHYVIEPDRLRAEIRDDFDGGPDADAEASSTEEATRLRRLRKLAADPDTLWKPHLVADAALTARLEAVRAMAPNAGEAVDVVVRAAHLSAVTGTPLDVPPLILLGPAGCGKTRLVRDLGRALDASVLTLLGSTMADATPIAGCGVGWRGAGPGRLAETLLRATTSGPLVFVDEVEKLRIWDRQAGAADLLLGVLDREMAATHEDAYLRLPMRADRVVWMLAANTLEGLSVPLLDRCLVIEMRAPGGAERREIVGRIHAETRARLGLDPTIRLDGPVIDLLDDVSLRRVAPAVQLALGRAVEAGRDWLGPDDVAWARALVERGHEPARARMGF